jgi:hypothetical protein
VVRPSRAASTLGSGDPEGVGEASDGVGDALDGSALPGVSVAPGDSVPPGGVVSVIALAVGLPGVPVGGRLGDVAGGGDPEALAPGVGVGETPAQAATRTIAR